VLCKDPYRSVDERVEKTHRVDVGIASM
jgi:hypothetical protein